MMKRVTLGILFILLILDPKVIPVSSKPIFRGIKLPKFERKIALQDITVTCYMAVPEQTDDTPFLTADGSDIRELDFNDTIGWCAISRDLRKHFKYGDTIVLSQPNGCDKYYIVHDAMNARCRRTIDLLILPTDVGGLWKSNVIKYNKN